MDTCLYPQGRPVQSSQQGVSVSESHESDHQGGENRYPPFPPAQGVVYSAQCEGRHRGYLRENRQGDVDPH